MTSEVIEPGGADLAVMSPDGRVRVVLEWLDEVHFGPPYFALWVQLLGQGDFSSPGRDVFHGAALAISPDSRFLVIERWSSLSDPDTSIVVLDLAKGREAEALHVGPGFLRAIEFMTDESRSSAKCIVTLDVFDGSGWESRQDSFELSTGKNWKGLTWWPSGQ